MDSVSELVARQYNNFVYPKPSTDLKSEIEKGRHQLGDPHLYTPLLWPEGRPKADLRILVAGCGTTQAAALAFTNPNSEIIGVDLSENSLAHERFLQDRHDLKNLRLFKGDLRDVGKIGEKFDLIFSTGVLHHMDNPEEGLSALGAVLTPHGVMALMVYGIVRRLGVYLLQDVFRRLNVKQDTQGVAFVRSVLSSLPDHHFVKWYTCVAPDLEYDAGIVDTFLHPKDKAYTVPEVIDLVEKCDLAFQGWQDNNSYYFENFVSPSSSLYTAMSALSVREQWAVAEKLNAMMGCHFFLAHHPSRSVPNPAKAFSDGSWINWFPVRHPRVFVLEPPSTDPDSRGKFGRGEASFHLSSAEILIFWRADGARSSTELLCHPELVKFPLDQRIEFGRRVLEKLWKLGHLMMSYAPAPSENAMRL